MPTRSHKKKNRKNRPKTARFPPIFERVSTFELDFFLIFVKKTVQKSAEILFRQVTSEDLAESEMYPIVFSHVF